MTTKSPVNKNDPIRVSFFFVFHLNEIDVSENSQALSDLKQILKNVDSEIMEPLKNLVKSKTEKVPYLFLNISTDEFLQAFVTMTD